MAEKKSNTAGLGLALLIVGLLICYAARLALHRTIALDDIDAVRQRSTAAALPDMRIDINSASAAELSVLPGIGPKLAERIVEYRQVHGAFSNINDLDRVSGIGKAIVERLSPYVVAIAPSHEIAAP